MRPTLPIGTGILAFCLVEGPESFPVSDVLWHGPAVLQRVVLHRRQIITKNQAKLRSSFPSALGPGVQT
jgi:hypothetical protein